MSAKYSRRRPLRRRRKRALAALPAGAVCLALIGDLRLFSAPRGIETGPPPATAALTGPPSTVIDQPASVPKILVGIGPEADVALESPLVESTPIGMLTSWYNKPADLEWMTTWKSSTVPIAYRAGYAHHLVVFTDDPETNINTAYGPGCGRPYPLSSEFIDHMRVLADVFAGEPDGPPLYVTLFTEFQTYACSDNAWNPNARTNAYLRALKDQYFTTMRIFHERAPNARVSIGWGGWQHSYDDRSRGGGRSMFGHFEDVMLASDFQSFQAMDTVENRASIDAMTQILGQYGPVMLAHYKPDNGSQSVFETDIGLIFDDEFLRRLTQKGLFSISLMDEVNANATEAAHQLVIHAIRRYARPA